MIQSKNLKLKLGLCGLALTSFLALNARGNTVHADTASGSNASAITWDSDQNDSQVVKEDSQQDNSSQSVQKQATVQSNVQVKQSQPEVAVANVSSTPVQQNRAEMSTVRSTSEQKPLTNQNDVHKSAVSVQNSRANLISNVDSASSTAIDDPANNQVTVHFINRSGVDQNIGYIVDTNSNQNNIDYKLPAGYQLANTNEKYSTASSTNNYYVFDKATQHGIDNGTKFASTLNKELQNKLQLSIGWVTNVDKNAADNIKHQDVILKANYSIYGVPRSQVPEIVQSDTGTTWDVENSTQIASKLGLSYDQLESIVYAATNGGNQWMRLNSILAKTTREVTETHTRFLDPNAYKIDSNNVYVMVTKPQSVDPNSSDCKRQAQRVIHIAFPNGVKPKSYDTITDSAGNKLTLDSNNNLTQTVTFTRTKTVDSLTGSPISQTPWQQHGAINAVTLPAIPGYTMVTNTK